MKLHITSLILLRAISSFAAENSALIWSIQTELRELNKSCKYDSCSGGQIRATLSSYACNCGTVCAQLGTCCIDAPYIGIKASQFRPTCRSLLDKDNSFYMVDRCSPDSAWKSLCEEEWNGDGDVMKLVPVTSLFTLITYKNYFCFRCHEDTDEVWYWNLKLESYDQLIDESKDISLSYDQTWVAQIGESGFTVPVNLTIQIPSEISQLPVSCDTKLISRCSGEWFDEDVRKKCEAYMGEIHVRRDNSTLKYRNVHCAKCNFEDLEKIFRKEPVYGGFGFGVPFSFTHLIDINRSDGDKVGKTEKCKSGYLWDPYWKKCRKLLCALDGYTVINGKCEKL